MKKLISLLLFASPFFAKAQIGLKAGLNFTNVTNMSSISNSSSSGFNFGVFYATPYQKIFGSKTELVWSRQGYSYATNKITGKVNLDYIMLPQYMCINITKFFQIQVGFQLAYLLNASADSSSVSNSSESGEISKAMDYYNRFNYGIGGGVEVHPFKGTLVGARINISLNDLYKIPDSGSSGEQPAYASGIDVKANLFQIYVGWRFGK